MISHQISVQLFVILRLIEHFLSFSFLISLCRLESFESSVCRSVDGLRNALRDSGESHGGVLGVSGKAKGREKKQKTKKQKSKVTGEKGKKKKRRGKKW